jgi:7-cyano-7-deazaguanine reductase
MSAAHPESLDAALSAMRALSVEDRKRCLKMLKQEREAAEAQKKQEIDLLPNSHWSKVHLLDRIPNPTHAAYEQKVLIPEFTFLGVANQPDFGEMLLTFYPGKWTIELKSLKVYKDAFRDAMLSYERLANVVFDDLMAAYEPRRLRLMMRLMPRGGISSCLTIDSDWAIRGGNEEFKDWAGNVDRFGFEATSTTRV